MKRLTTINTLFGSDFTELKKVTTKIDSPYVVDDSYFCPTSEALKQLNGSRPLTDEEIKACYDFSNGIDNGMKIPLSRSHEFNDIAEYSQEIREEQEQVSNKLETFRKDLQRKQKQLERENAVSQTPTPAPAPSSGATGNA